MTGAVVAVEELRRAYAAVCAGAFRTAQSPSGGNLVNDPGQSGWSPPAGERVVLVAPVAAGVGATTVALALATAAGTARLVECCTGSASALAAAADAELGRAMGGWLEGSRDGVLLQRRSDRITGPSDVPVPPSAHLPVTVVDAGWCIEDLLEDARWLGGLARSVDSLVLVAPATIPGLRRAENALRLVTVERALLVLVGLRSRRWPRPLERSAGYLVRRLRAAGRITEFGFDSGLALSGLTPGPLPGGVVRAAGTLLATIEGVS